MMERLDKGSSSELVDDVPGLCAGHIIPSHRRDNASMTEIMDPQLWSSLPNHILEHVLAFLPFWAILQLQCVSKKWKNSLLSMRFLSRWRKKSPPEVLFVMFADCWRRKAVAAFNPSLNKWHIIPISHTPHMLNDFNVITSAGGLLCLEEIAWPNRWLFVYNPMNGSYKRLPPWLDMKSPYVVGMMVDDDQKGYRVLVAQDGEESLVSQYYDSTTESWKMNTVLDAKFAMLAGMATLQRFLFCLSFWPPGLIAYDIEEARWRDLQVKMPASISSPHLIHSNGQLVLVGALEEYGQIVSIQIWKLDVPRKKWLEIERMPQPVFEVLRVGVAEHFSCMGEGGFVCFSGDNMRNQVLMYDMSNNSWHWLPPCPFHEVSPKTQEKYALDPLGFPIMPCFLTRP